MPHFAYATTNEIGNERSAIDLGVGEEVTGPIPLVVGLDDDSERLEARPEDDIVRRKDGLRRKAHQGSRRRSPGIGRWQVSKCAGIRLSCQLSRYQVRGNETRTETTAVGFDPYLFTSLRWKGLSKDKTHSDPIELLRGQHGVVPVNVQLPLTSVVDQGSNQNHVKRYSKHQRKNQA